MTTKDELHELVDVMLEQLRRQIRLLRGEDDADGQPQP